MEEIIHLENIRFSYGDVEAIRDVSLSLRGGIFGLLGPNGAGKTTLMKLLLGFLRPASGSGEIMGQALGEEQKSLRRGVGYMPESDCLIPGMDAVSLTAYLGELSGMPRQEAMKRAHDVLYYVGLDESRYRLVETYSTGMKQRLKLAQALVHDPRLLLLDEPFTGLDPQRRALLRDALSGLASRGTQLVMAVHHHDDLPPEVNRRLHLERGRGRVVPIR
jgi:ABC-2 type transport system ATP-binding protein